MIRLYQLLDQLSLRLSSESGQYNYKRVGLYCNSNTHIPRSVLYLDVLNGVEKSYICPPKADDAQNCYDKNYLNMSCNIDADITYTM